MFNNIKVRKMDNLISPKNADLEYPQDCILCAVLSVYFETYECFLMLLPYIVVDEVSISCISYRLLFYIFIRKGCCAFSGIIINNYYYTAHYVVKFYPMMVDI